MIDDRRFATGLIAALGVAYCLAVLPFLFFRHDDWWILGNSMRHLPGNWGFLWKPSLYFGGQEIVWFFRPGFKLFVFGFYELFGFHYWLWMGVLLAFFLATVWLGYQTAVVVTGNTKNGLWFAVAMTASFALHFGSLAWMGEGMMNIPQGFLLMLCVYCFCRARRGGARGWEILSGVAFLVALGFKESSVFLLLFLAALLLAQPSMRPKDIWAGVSVLAPFVLITVPYLVARLGWMPLNPSYLPNYGAGGVLRSLVLAGAPLLLPLVVWIAVLGVLRQPIIGYLRSLYGRLYFLPFVGVCTGVHLGHGFFSPGWLLMAGLFTLLGFSLGKLPDGLKSTAFLRFGLLVLVFSLGPVLVRLDSLGWWHWHQAQRGVFEKLAQAPVQSTQLTLRACENPAYPGVTFDRVVANPEGLRQLWFLLHGRDIGISRVPCESPIEVQPDQVILDWKFPANV